MKNFKLIAVAGWILFIVSVLLGVFLLDSSQEKYYKKGYTEAAQKIEQNLKKMGMIPDLSGELKVLGGQLIEKDISRIVLETNPLKIDLLNPDRKIQIIGNFEQNSKIIKRVEKTDEEIYLENEKAKNDPSVIVDPFNEEIITVDDLELGQLITVEFTEPINDKTSGTVKEIRVR